MNDGCDIWIFRCRICCRASCSDIVQPGNLKPCCPPARLLEGTLITVGLYTLTSSCPLYCFQDKAISQSSKRATQWGLCPPRFDFRKLLFKLMTVHSFKTIYSSIAQCSLLFPDTMWCNTNAGGRPARAGPVGLGAVWMTEVAFAFLISKQILSLVLTLLGKCARV